MSRAPEIRNQDEILAAAAAAGRLWIHVGHLDFFAQWETVGAPRTCDLFRGLLPLRAKIIHCSWSGEGVWVPLEKWDAHWPKEQETSHPKPGQLLLYPGDPSEPELLIPCGQCLFNSRFGVLSGNHFATIVEGGNALLELHRLALWQGAQDCTIEKISAG